MSHVCVITHTHSHTFVLVMDNLMLVLSLKSITSEGFTALSAVCRGRTISGETRSRNKTSNKGTFLEKGVESLPSKRVLERCWVKFSSVIIMLLHIGETLVHHFLNEVLFGADSRGSFHLYTNSYPLAHIHFSSLVFVKSFS